MSDNKFYTLDPLPFDYKALQPFLSEQLLQLHHDKHHAAYVKGANAILEKMDDARKQNQDFPAVATFRELSFHIGGNMLHNLYWGNLQAQQDSNEPSDNLMQMFKEEYGSFERFQKIFTETALKGEGSSWACLTFCLLTQRPIIMYVEKHNLNIYPEFGILMVLDMWEHAYYLDYKNDKAAYVQAFWKAINWQAVEERLNDLQKWA